MPKTLALLLACALPAVARADIATKCQGLAKPVDYDEQVQQDFLANYSALASTMSPIHGPIPHEAGRGAIGLDLLGMPPLDCAHRYVLEWTKTEDTNVTPVVPRPRITFGLHGPGDSVIYGGFAYLPPVTLLGTRNVIVGGELGLGAKIGDHLQAGARIHAQVQKTVGDVAQAFDTSTQPAVNDMFIGSTMGADATAGWSLGAVTPYVAVGVLDVSTVFIVGDDLVIANNYHPYFGPAFSLGADALFKHLRVGGEVYSAPGGHSLPDATASVVDHGAFGRYGHITTLRFRVGYEL